MKFRYLVAILAPLLFVSACKKKRCSSLDTSSSSTSVMKAKDLSEESDPRKKIIIFMSAGGGGHISVSNALKKYIGSEYNLKVVNLVNDVLPTMDPIRNVTFGKYTGEDLYNFFLKNQLIWFANKLCMQYGSWQILSVHREVERLVNRYIKKEKPDLMLSVIPIFNYSLLNVAKKNDIPLMVLTNDLDTTNYIVGMEGDYGDKFAYTLPYDDPRMHEKIAQANIPKENLHITGFPLRPDFFDKKNRQEVKAAFNMPKDRPVVMILMGGQGSYASYKYAKQIIKMARPLHLVVCLGRNEQLRAKIDKLKKRSRMVSIQTIGFTDKISDLMAASDLLITKSGPGSISEAVYMNLPMLVDVTTRPLDWEKLNVTFVEENGFGETISNYRQVPQMIARYLDNPSHYSRIKSNLQAFPKVRCTEKVRSLVASLLTRKSEKSTQKDSQVPVVA